MSDWTTRLPYAHRYITKTLFEGAEADLDPPEIIFMDPAYEMRPTHMHRPVYSTCSTTGLLERIKRYYYEVSVPLGVQRSNLYEWLAIGYTGPSAAILYAKDGAIFMNSSRDPVHAAIPYSTGDIVGCGYEFPSRFFFTKNGIYLGHCIAHLGSNALLPEARTWDMDLGFQEPINLGQRPFMFDIEGHFDKRCARLRRLTASLPLEILENILQFALVTQYINHLLHFSRVCHRWHTLMFRSVIDLSIVTRKDLGDLLKILKTRTPILARSVTTQESSDEIWLHRFLAFPLPYIRSTSTLSIQTPIQHQRSLWYSNIPPVQRQRFLGKAPSFLSQRLLGLLRRAFTELRSLSLSGYTFSTLTRFAQVVFALKRLEFVGFSKVTWDSSPTTPPTWSTSTLSIQIPIQHQRSPHIIPPIQRQRFLGIAPSFLSQRVPGLLRRAFTEVHMLELSGYSFPTWTRFVQVVFALQRLETLVCSSVTWDTSPTTPPTWLTFSKRLRHASFVNMDGQCIVGSWWLFLAGRPRQPSNDLVLIPSDISVIGQLASFIHLWNFTLSWDSRDYILPRTYTITYDQKQDQLQSCSLSLMIQNQTSAAHDLFLQFERNGVAYQATRIDARLTWGTFTTPDYSTLQEVGRCSTALSSANLCHLRFELSGPQRSGGLLCRRRVAKAVMRQHSAGLLECTWNGVAIEDTDGVQWLKPGAAVTFGVERTYKRGTSGRLTWDVDAVHLNHRVETIPWLKLYKRNDQITNGQFIADVAFNIDALSGQAEFLLPNSAAPGRYFLVVGDYVYRTKCFQIIP